MAVTLADVKAYLGTTSVPDATITAALAAEAAAQAAVVQATYIAAANAAVEEALKRRVARNLAMRGQPLAVLAAEFDGGSAQVLPGRDPEVRRLEAPFRRLVLG